MKYCAGVDIGGTKTVVCIADSFLNPIKSVTFKTESQLGAESLVKRIGETYCNLLLDLGIKSCDVEFCGVASPGPLDVKRGLILHISTMGFKNVPIKEMIEKELSLPVYLENDANCAALAESKIGVGRGLDPLVYVTVSTGIGSGIVIGGKLLSGYLSSAGELGHLTVEENGRECPCGKKGCLEIYSSGTAIASDASKALCKTVTTKEAFELARNGNEAIKKIIENAADKLGLALSSVYHVIDPACIVLGGSVTKAYDDFKKPLYKALSKYTQPVEGREFDIRVSSFDGEQVILGALIYGKEESENESAKS